MVRDGLSSGAEPRLTSVADHLAADESLGKSGQIMVGQNKVMVFIRVEGTIIRSERILS